MISTIAEEEKVITIQEIKKSTFLAVQADYSTDKQTDPIPNHFQIHP